uniref:Uncharacterized protein n=1 Tax=Romanomermis culicivorax TaxID=13658 RepID=A0A915IB43_ROMCU
MDAKGAKKKEEDQTAGTPIHTVVETPQELAALLAEEYKEIQVLALTWDTEEGELLKNTKLPLARSTALCFSGRHNNKYSYCFNAIKNRRPHSSMESKQLRIKSCQEIAKVHAIRVDADLHRHRT